MKAFVLRGEWAPRPGYVGSPQERVSRKASVASQVWRNPAAAVEHVNDPLPDHDEVIVRIRACGVCGSDVHCVYPDEEGYLRFSGPARLPVILGHEYAGEVVEIGRGVRTLAVGDPVAAEGMLWCGLCEPCRRGAPNQCRNLEMVGFSSPGAYAEFVATRERYCWSLRPLEGRSVGSSIFETGAMLEPAGCAYNGLFIGHDRFKPGVRVAVWGAGPIGLAAVALARAAGASLVVAVEPVEERRALALRLGAQYVFSPDDFAGRDVCGPCDDLTKGDGFDLCIEAAGAAHRTVPLMQRALSANGRIVYLGRTGQSAAIDLDGLVSGACTVAGSRGHAGGGIYPNLIRMVASGLLPLEQMVTHRVAFPQVREALSAARDRRSGKVMVIRG